MNASRLFVFTLLITILSLSLMPVSAKEGGDPELYMESNAKGEHEVLVEASQWEFVAYDMVQVARLIADEGLSEKDAKVESTYKHRIGRFNKDTTVILTVISRDVQHGFAINELGVLIATIRPTVGQEFGAPTTTSFTTPNEDVTYSAFCHIFCGLGHPDMKLKFVIGEGSPEYGRYVYWSIIALNLGIVGYAFSKLYKKMNEVVTA